MNTPQEYLGLVVQILQNVVAAIGELQQDAVVALDESNQRFNTVSQIKISDLSIHWDVMGIPCDNDHRPSSFDHLLYG